MLFFNIQEGEGHHGGTIIKLKDITASQFHTIDGPRQVIVHDSPRRYAIVETQTAGAFGLCWASDRIEPVCKIHDNHLWLGVDQRLAVIDLQKGRVVFSMAVPTVLNIELFDDVAVVLTDVSAIIISRGFSFRSNVHCDGLPVSVEWKDGQGSIVLETGHCVPIP